MKINNSKSVNKAKKDEALALRDSVCLFRGPPKDFLGLEQNIMESTMMLRFLIIN